MSEEKTLQPGEMMPIDEYMQKREIYEKSFLYKLPHKSRLFMHPVLLVAITIQNRLNGFHVKMLRKTKLPNTKPIIFCITHIGKHDIEICSEVLKKHYYLLSGDFENLHGTFDGTFIELNGIIYMNKYHKEDKAKAKETMVSVLTNGGNIMWFPKGVWNLSANLPVLPLPFGIIEVAQKADAYIVPVAIEQYEKDFYVNIGQAFDVGKFAEQWHDEKECKLNAIAQLRDMMATLKWEIWQHQEPLSRKVLPNNYFELFINEKLNQWHGFTYADVRAREFRIKGEISPQEAFAHLDQLIPCRENAFLFGKG